MAELNKRDYEIILTFGLHVAKVDQEFDVYERKILSHLVEVMGITRDVQSQLLQDQNSLAVELEELSSEEAQVLLIKTLCAVAHANGTIHQAEADFINKVNALLGQPITLLSWDEWKTYEMDVLGELKALGSL